MLISQRPCSYDVYFQKCVTNVKIKKLMKNFEKQ